MVFFLVLGNFIDKYKYLPNITIMMIVLAEQTVTELEALIQCQYYLATCTTPINNGNVRAPDNLLNINLSALSGFVFLTLIALPARNTGGLSRSSVRAGMS